LYLPAKAVLFTSDQARDAFTVQELLGGHLKLLGPSVSGIPGFFHRLVRADFFNIIVSSQGNSGLERL
jgi:hypothetical protein